MDERQLEQAFYERNCPTCIHFKGEGLKILVLDRLAGREFRKKSDCELPSGSVMTHEQRLKVIFGIGHKFHAGDCPKYKEKE
jgi:hypothetical protein